MNDSTTAPAEDRIADLQARKAKLEALLEVVAAELQIAQAEEMRDAAKRRLREVAPPSPAQIAAGKAAAAAAAAAREKKKAEKEANIQQ